MICLSFVPPNQRLHPTAARGLSQAAAGEPRTLGRQQWRVWCLLNAASSEMVGSAESHRFIRKIAAALGAVALMALIGSLRPNLFWPIRLIPPLLPGNPT
jgi:hypothetical protein